MIKETTENLYPFIASQLPKKYGDCNTRTRFYNEGMIPHYTTLILCKGPKHYLTISYIQHLEEFEISLRKTQGLINKVTIHKYA